MEKVDRESFLALKRIEEILGEGAIIDIRTGHHARRGNVLVWIAAFHDQRDPLRDLLLVIRVFHPVITMMCRERREALFEKRDVLRSAHKTHVGYGMDKGARVFDRALFDQIGPELAGEIKLGVDFESL